MRARPTCLMLLCLVQRQKNGEKEILKRKEISVIMQRLINLLANIESYNAVLIEQKFNQSERLEKLRELAVKQLKAIEKIDLSSIKLPDESNEQ